MLDAQKNKGRHLPLPSQSKRSLWFDVDTTELHDLMPFEEHEDDAMV